MKVQFWVKVTGKRNGQRVEGVRAAPKLSVCKPECGAMEVPVKIELDIPDNYFLLPELLAHISLPDQRGGIKPVSVEMQDRVAKMLKQELGVNATFVTQPPPEKQ